MVLHITQTTSVILINGIICLNVCFDKVVDEWDVGDGIPEEGRHIIALLKKQERYCDVPDLGCKAPVWPSKSANL